MKRLNIFLILAISFLAISISFVVDSNVETQRIRERSEGVQEIGSVTLKDYEAMYDLDKEHLCNICDQFYCDRNLNEGCDFCTEKCKWYNPVKEFFIS